MCMLHLGQTLSHLLLVVQFGKIFINVQWDCSLQPTGTTKHDHFSLLIFVDSTTDPNCTAANNAHILYYVWVLSESTWASTFWRASSTLSGIWSLIMVGEISTSPKSALSAQMAWYTGSSPPHNFLQTKAHILIYLLFTSKAAPQVTLSDYWSVLYFTCIF